MNIQSSMQSQGQLVGLAAIAIAIGALAACSGGSSQSSKTSDPAATTGTTEDSTSANASDPAATNKQLRDTLVANGSMSARKPCDLLTQADSEATVGEPLPKKKENLTLGACDYSVEVYSAGTSLTVGSWEEVKATATGGPHKPQAISGVGDEALTLSPHGSASILYVRKGGEGFFVEVSGPKVNGSFEEGLAKEKELALKVLAKF